MWLSRQRRALSNFTEGSQVCSAPPFPLFGDSGNKLPISKNDWVGKLFLFFIFFPEIVQCAENSFIFFRSPKGFLYFY